MLQKNKCDMINATFLNAEDKKKLNGFLFKIFKFVKLNVHNILSNNNIYLFSQGK